MKTIKTYQADQSEGIYLNANESVENLPLSIREEIAAAVLNLEYNRYPADDCQGLLDAYANVLGISSEMLIAGNGSDEMLGLLISVYASNKTIYTLDPDFSMYDYYASMQSATLLKYEHDLDRPFDVEDFIAKGEKSSLVLFSNPNNPTGMALTTQQLCRIIEAFAPKLVIIDEAYSEFNDETMLDKLNEYDNLILTRTLSKAYGSANLRVGFAISNQNIIKDLKSAKVPYNVNGFSQLAATIVLNHAAMFKQRIEEIIQEREKMLMACQQLEHFKCYDSKANFIYFKSEYKALFLKRLGKIKVRNYSDDSFRITIGNKEQNQEIIDLLMQADKEVI